MGVVREDVFEIISDKQGRAVIPAYVSFPDHGEPLVGFEAKAQAYNNPKNTVYDVRSVHTRVPCIDPVVEYRLLDLWWVETF